MLFVFTILLDQLSKYLIRFSGGFYICNSGISFGVKMPTALFWLLWIIFIAFLTSYTFSKTENQKLRSIGITLILSGAFSNIIDRLTFGCVIDFINLKFWPIFNLADVFIFFGAIITISSIFKNKN
ncbi:MAG: hypothetical protein ACD_15C00064G0009 [uncultured bacterium]|nr:MAG: hypothetical protein ACD_15C00064G0009 [uncultured bacterium]HCU70777.1 signal peptidase II [Candidatus Moranbacteria bacterium]